MQLTERHIVKDKNIMQQCVKAKNLYNQSLYYFRQVIFGKIQPFTEHELMKLFAEYNEENFRSLPAGVSQQIIKFTYLNVKNWIRLRKAYKKDNSKISIKPSLPKYKKEVSELYFTYQQVKLKNGFVHFPKSMNIKPVKTRIQKLISCRIIPKSNHSVIEFVHTVNDKQVKTYNGNWLSIDIGLNNLATCVSNSVQPFIVNGKPSKSVNNFYNKRNKYLQSLLVKSKFKSKRLDRLTFSRNQKIQDYIHKASRKIVNTAKENNITKIIIGKNENWKQAINIGKKSNREFTSIPHATLIEKIQYKARLEGIEVVLTQEAYTSKCSALDLEPILKRDKYLGKRKKRGLFVTATGKIINADINGSLNIARLVLGDEIINSDSIRSCVAQPYKIKTFV